MVFAALLKLFLRSEPLIPSCPPVFCAAMSVQGRKHLYTVWIGSDFVTCDVTDILQQKWRDSALVLLFVVIDFDLKKNLISSTCMVRQTGLLVRWTYHVVLFYPHFLLLFSNWTNYYVLTYAVYFSWYWFHALILWSYINIIHFICFCEPVQCRCCVVENSQGARLKFYLPG